MPELELTPSQKAVLDLCLGAPHASRVTVYSARKTGRTILARYLANAHRNIRVHDINIRTSSHRTSSGKLLTHGEKQTTTKYNKSARAGKVTFAPIPDGFVTPMRARVVPGPGGLPFIVIVDQ